MRVIINEILRGLCNSTFSLRESKNQERNLKVAATIGEFRLPTEAEWEYAARGGNKTRGYKYAGSNSVDKVAWYGDNSGTKRLDCDKIWSEQLSEYSNILLKNNCKTHPVGQKQANELGIYDMSGNVWEWCEDWYGDYRSGAQTNPTGPNSGSYRVLRGGGWYGPAVYCRSAGRGGSAPSGGWYGRGFRLVLPAGQ